MNSSYQVKELSFIKLIENGFIIYQELIWSIIKIIVFIATPISIVNHIVNSLVQGQVFSTLLDFAFTFLHSISSLAVILIVAKYINNSNFELKNVLMEVLKKWDSIIITGILLVVIVGIFFVLLVVPGVIALVYCAFVYHAIILKDRSGLDALKYSKSLIQGHWWKVFFLSIVFFVPAIGINRMMLFFNDSMLMKVLSGVIQSFIHFLNLTVMTLFFVNLDLRKDS